MPEARNNQDDYIISGKPLDDFTETRQAGQILLDQMKKHGDKLTHVDASNGVAETFADFRLSCLRTAHWMRSKYNVSPAHPVSICAGNSSDVFATAVAAMLCGAPYNVLDPGLSKDDLAHMMLMLKPNVIFCVEESVDIIKKALQETQPDNEIPIIVYDTGYRHQQTKHNSFREFQKETGNEENFQVQEIKDLKKTTALVLCSSGTTGLPKGVELSHYYLIQNIMNNRIFDVNHVFAFSTLYWLSGTYVLFNALYNGCFRIYTPATFTEKLCAQIIHKYKPDSVFLAPSNINRMMKYPELSQYDWSCIKLMLVGGGKVDYKSLIKFKQETLPGCKIQVGYGMTEVGMATTKFIDEPVNESVGTVNPGVSIKVIDRDTNKTLPPGEIGEILIRTDRVMLGYRNNPESTADTLDQEGWIHSGDAGYIDENGFVYITDRYKEMLKYHNWPICPAEIETVLRSHNAVVESVVVGVPYEDHGDLLVAFVMTAPLVKVTQQELKDLVADRLADAKRLRGGVIFLKELPTLPSGKLDRKTLKKQANIMADKLRQNAEL